MGVPHIHRPVQHRDGRPPWCDTCGLDANMQERQGVLPPLGNSVTSTWEAKPLNVEAAKVTPETAKEIALWCGGVVVEEVSAIDHDDVYVGINVPTMGGVVRASQGQLVVRGANGGFYVAKEQDFINTFQPKG